MGVLGYGTRRFPGFFISDSGFELDWQVDTPAQVAAVIAARTAQGVHRGGLVLANALPIDEQLDPQLHDRVLADGLRLLRDRGVTGKAVTFRFLSDEERTRIAEEAKASKQRGRRDKQEE